MKGQSSVEYAVTYGWMIAAVAIAGTTFYTQNGPGISSTECNSQIEKIEGSDISLTGGGITGNGLELVFESSRLEGVEVKQVNISNKNIQRSKPIKVDGNGTSYLLAKANSTSANNCQDIDLQVQYETQYINNLEAEYQLRLPVDGLENLILYLKRSGGEIPRLNINSTLKPTNETICFGRNCPDTYNKSAEEYAERDGDKIFGTVDLKQISFECVGGDCPNQTGNYKGFINRSSDKVDGTLWVKQLKPWNNKLCIGEC